MSETLKYSIEPLEFLKDDDYIMIARCKILRVETPTFWDTRFYEEDILANIDTLKLKPVIGIWKDSLFGEGDFKEHARNESDKKKIKAFGVIPESNDAKIEEIDGEKWLTCLVVFWKHYNKNMVDKIIFNAKDGNQTDISMEIMADKDSMEKLEDGTTRIKKWTFMAISALGADYEPAVDDAGISSDAILKFSKADDYKQLLEETNKAMQNYSMEGEQKVKLTVGQIREIIGNDLQQYKVKYQNDDYEYRKYWLEDYDDSYVYVYNCEDCKVYRMTYTLDEENKTAKVDIESATLCINAGYVAVGEGEKEEDVKTYSQLKEELESYSKKVEDADKAKTEVEEKYSTCAKEKEEIEGKYSKAVEDLTDVTSKYSKLSQDYSVLKDSNEVLTSKNTELETYKAGKEKAEQDAIADDLFGKYAKYFEDDKAEEGKSEGKVREGFREILYSKGKTEFEKEVSAYVLPKIEAENIAIASKYSKGEKNEEILDYSIFPTNKEEDNSEEAKTNEYSNVFDRLESYVKSKKQK